MMRRQVIGEQVHHVRDGIAVCGVRPTDHTVVGSAVTCPKCLLWALENRPKPGDIVRYTVGLKVDAFTVRLEHEDGTLAEPLINEVAPVVLSTIFIRTWVKGQDIHWYVGKGFTVERGQVHVAGRTRTG